MKVFVVFIFFIFMTVSAFSMNVQSIQCGHSVKNRKIVKKSDNFIVGDTICCLSDIRDIHKNTYIIHRWVLRNMQYDIKLKIKPYNRFRTWSCKKARNAGVWKLEVLDSNGHLLKEKIFTVKKGGD